MIDHLDVMMPWALLSGGILITLLVSVIRVDTKRPAQISAVITLLATLISCLGLLQVPAETVFSGIVEISPLTHFILALFSAIGILFILGGDRYLNKEGLHLSDYYHLLLILILGASALTCSKDLVVTFISLEVMSLPAYTLTGFRRNDSRSNEAAIKYYILGGAIGAAFLLGTSFMFGATGSTNLNTIFTWSQSGHSDMVIFGMGHLLILIAFMFKVAAAPFHFWKPDVYEGAPTPVTGIMATVVTTAAFVTLVRLIHIVDFNNPSWATYAVTVKHFIRWMAALSLIVGSAVIITQKNLKRMLAYSSISHTGYLLLGVLGSLGKGEEIQSVMIYLFGYTLMTSGIFALMSQSEPKADTGIELIDLTGLMKRSPIQTMLWSIFFFSMAGMPFTVGFFTKYFVFMSSIGSGETPLVVLAALCTVVSAYAYMRPIALMVMRDADPTAANWNSGFWSQIVAVAAAAGVVFLGVMPNAMIQYLKGIPLIH